MYAARACDYNTNTWINPHSHTHTHACTYTRVDGRTDEKITLQRTLVANDEHGTHTRTSDTSMIAKIVYFLLKILLFFCSRQYLDNILLSNSFFFSPISLTYPVEVAQFVFIQLKTVRSLLPSPIQCQYLFSTG